MYGAAPSSLELAAWVGALEAHFREPRQRNPGRRLGGPSQGVVAHSIPTTYPVGRASRPRVGDGPGPGATRVTTSSPRPKTVEEVLLQQALEALGRKADSHPNDQGRRPASLEA